MTPGDSIIFYQSHSSDLTDACSFLSVSMMPLPSKWL
jgi:hypothetical protein